jgi:hypothetical protein
MPPRKVEEVEEVEEAEIFEAPNGAKYKVVGVCLVCNNKVYQCITHPLRDGMLDSKWAAVYVPGASMMGAGEKEMPMLYCQEDDPTRSMRRDGIRPGEHLPGDQWTPKQ